MVNIIKRLFTYISTLYIKITCRIKCDDSWFTLVRFRIKGNHTIRFSSSRIEKTFVDIQGTDNMLNVEQSLILDSSITIAGNGNSLILSPKVKLRKATIIIRGDNCKISIDSNTTFGGVRMINTGKGNLISIGSDCLFSDYIEIWASDTHPIYNAEKELINPDKPVIIGNHVWVGSRVIILKGITISDGSIIGMGSVVTKSVPAGVISAGYPNKTIKEDISWDLHY